jgi:hypothetical protein
MCAKEAACVRARPALWRRLPAQSSSSRRLLYFVRVSRKTKAQRARKPAHLENCFKFLSTAAVEVSLPDVTQSRH